LGPGGAGERRGGTVYSPIAALEAAELLMDTMLASEFLRFEATLPVLTER
jgi:hypothetical protein